ncbi:MAG: AmmeMemoRadiSam system radical SAM enzyme [Sphaerochaeta sp.]
MTCNFCFRHCDINECQTGYCRTRKVVDNKIISTSYGYLEAMAIDPIEKKPLYHFLPGTKTLSVAEAGCNFRCDFCQNWQLSQREKGNKSVFVSPEKLVELAIEYKIPSISFTYSEPIVWQDYVLKTSVLAKKQGIKTIMVTNGSFSEEAREAIAPLIDAFNIDFKGNAEYYRTICKGELVPVLKGIEYMIKQNCHVEVTTLIIQGIHTKEIIEKMGNQLKSCGVKVWHLTRFFPNYKMSERKPTDEKFLSEIYEIAKKSRIPYIYRGNTKTINQTVCMNCKKLLISNHDIPQLAQEESKENIQNNKCKYCGYHIYGVF